MVQEQSEVERLRLEVGRLRRALARAGIDADEAAAGRAESDARQGADLAISRAETAVARDDARRTREQARLAGATHAAEAATAAAALSTSQALVAELRTNDRRQAALIELGDRLRDLRDRAAIAQAGAEVVAMAIDAARAAYGMVDSSAETVAIENEWSAPGVSGIAGTYRWRDFGAYIDDLKRGQTVVIDDTLTDPRTSANAPAFRAVNILSLINVPLVERGRLVAVLIIQHDGPHAWTVDELAFVTAAADRIRAAVARGEAEARQEVLNREISHRLKNTLAIVQAIATQTLRDPPSLAEARKALSDRLLALGKAHDALMTGGTDATTVDKVVEGTMALHNGGAARIRAAGPAVEVGPSPALSLALMLHELATNAAKYGALSAPGGHVDLAWGIEPAESQDTFVLTWSEAGGPPVVPPSRRGFGSRLIERGFGGDAAVTLAFEPSGVVSTLRTPLAAFGGGDAAR